MFESDEETIDLFQEPAGWKPTQKEPTYAEHTLHSGVQLQLQLVGHNPLWVRFRSHTFRWWRVCILQGWTHFQFLIEIPNLYTQGHLLWNAGRTVSEYLEENRKTLVDGKAILELGAGAGLPSLVCALNGAAIVVTTDYPDPELVDNLKHNIQHCKLLTEYQPIFVEVVYPRN